VEHYLVIPALVTVSLVVIGYILLPHQAVIAVKDIDK